MRTKSGQSVQAIYALDGDNQTAVCVIDCEYRDNHPIADLVIEASDIAAIQQLQATTQLVGLKAVRNV